MIPAEEERPKTILDSFIDGLGGENKTISSKRDDFHRLIHQFLESSFMKMDSWEDWHDWLLKYGILQAVSMQHDYRNESWCKWARRKGHHIYKSPAQKDYEWLLIPEKTIEKMIILGILRK